MRQATKGPSPPAPKKVSVVKNSKNNKCLRIFNCCSQAEEKDIKTTRKVPGLVKVPEDEDEGGAEGVVVVGVTIFVVRGVVVWWSGGVVRVGRGCA